MIQLNEQLWHKKMSQQQFLECVNNGMTINEIKNKFHYKRRDPVVEMAKRLGLYENLKELELKHSRTSKYDKNEIKAAILSGLTHKELLKKFKCNKKVIYSVCKEFNIKVKTSTEHRILHLDFTEDEFQVLYGGLLGDSHLSRVSNNAQGSFNHCIKQLEYAKYKQEFLKRFTNPIKIVNKYDKRVNKSYQQCYCYIKGSTALNALYDKIYQNKIKYIDKELLYSLNPLGLAIWFMDDGSYDPYGYILCTDSFSKDDLSLIQKFFKEKYNIETSIRKNNEIYIKASSRETFKSLIKPYIHESMLYKL